VIRSAASEIQDIIRDFPDDEVSFALEVWKIAPQGRNGRRALEVYARSLEGEAEEFFLDYLHMRLDPDELTLEDEERYRASREQIARGEYVTLEELKARYEA